MPYGSLPSTGQRNGLHFPRVRGQCRVLQMQRKSAQEKPERPIVKRQVPPVSSAVDRELDLWEIDLRKLIIKSHYTSLPLAADGDEATTLLCGLANKRGPSEVRGSLRDILLIKPTDRPMLA